MELLKRFIRDEKGLETVEYAVIIGLILSGTILAIGLIGGQVQKAFESLVGAF
ncbi:MAG: Flp family type IVb pilin [Planctomycetota bacterium]